MKISKYFFASLVIILLINKIIAQDRNIFPPQFESKNKNQAGEFLNHPLPISPFIHDLSDEQKGLLKKIETSFMKNILPIENQIGEKEAALKTQAALEKVDMTQLDKTIDEIGLLKTKIRKLEMEKIQSIRKLLTDEQRIFFDSNKDRHQFHQMPR